MEIAKEFTFDAAHHLPKVPPDHKCGRNHGHTYRVRLHVDGPVDPDMGWVMDYGDMKEAWKFLEAKHLDHRDLNDWLANPTAEVLAEAIAEFLIPDLPLLVAVDVHETASTSATWVRP